VRVLVDVVGMDREFDYSWPDRLGEPVVGTVVRVPLGGRRTRGWVVASDSVPPPQVKLREVAAIVGRGPAPELVELAGWAARRWVGSRVRFLRTASAHKVVKAAPETIVPARAVPRPGSARRQVLRVPPAGDDVGAVVGRLAAWVRPDSSALVLVPSISRLAELAGRLASSGLRVAVMPEDWEKASSGGRVVVGARAAAWAPAPGLAGVVVLDAHDEGFREEAAPTWDAVSVVEERARRAGVPFVAVSPCPTVELLQAKEVVTVERSSERRGWAALVVVDMAKEDPASGLLSRGLLGLVSRTVERGGQVLCVLNRRGRATLLACGACRRLCRCHSCTSPMRQVSEELCCTRCGESRPVICDVCGATRMKIVRPGISRIAEELAAASGLSVEEGGSEVGKAPVVVGTEAILHRFHKAAAVAFVDFDSESMAPRLNAGAHALALLAKSSRLVGGRTGTVLVQTRAPDQEVIQAALHGDPSLYTRPEAERRRELGLPPYSALAELSGAGAEDVARSIPGAVEVQPGRFLVRAPDHESLSEAIRAALPSAGRKRVRVAVDPVGL
jgi:primosomal protein N' (replication factor Y)